MKNTNAQQFWKKILKTFSKITFSLFQLNNEEEEICKIVYFRSGSYSERKFVK